MPEQGTPGAGNGKYTVSLTLMGGALTPWWFQLAIDRETWKEMADKFAKFHSIGPQQRAWDNVEQQDYTLIDNVEMDTHDDDCSDTDSETPRESQRPEKIFRTAVMRAVSDQLTK